MKWKAEFVYEKTLSTITEINILKNGIVQIAIDDKGEKSGTRITILNE